jgi:cyclophilin family peptidyl-prolyl cis-trans isomerase
MSLSSVLRITALAITTIFLVTTANGGVKHMNKTENPVVLIKTSEGDIKVELYRDKAPATVANFLEYVKNKAYDGTIFHRVIDNFMIQGGGFTPSMHQINTLPPIKNEASNGLKNKKGTIAMARTNEIDSATSQFFINLKDNDFLNHRGNSPHEFGYAVFGRVVEGMDVVEKIGHAKTVSKGYFRDVPEKTIVIKTVEIVKP